MQRSCLFCAGFWPFILLPLIPLIFAIAFQWRAIESDVAENAQSALNNAGANWSSVTTKDRGREVKLLGSSSSIDDVDDAVALAKNAKGVNSVTWGGEVLPQTDDTTATPNAVSNSSPNLEIELNNNGLSLTGLLNPADVNEDVLGEIKSLFADQALLNQIKLNDSVNSAVSLPALAGILSNLPAGSKLALDNDVLSIKGQVGSLGLKKQASKIAAEAFNGEIDNQLIVKLTEIVEEDKVSVDECQRLFNNLTASQTVNFETGSNVVLSDSYRLLDDFTTLSRRCPEALFEVGGHTDSSGNLAFNMQLSQARAEAVIAHIIDSGVQADRFTAKGYGPSKPIADNSSDQGRAKNRRVEFTVTNN